LQISKKGERMNHFKFIWGLGLALVLALLCSCASTDKSTPAPQASKQSGFLSNYDLLKPVEGNESAKSWRLPEVNWKQYNKVLIERIKIFIKEDSKNKGIDPTDLKMLTDYFYGALVKEVKPTAEIVDKGGPDVIGIRIAVVDLVPTAYMRSVAGSLIPYGFVAEAASGPASGRPAGSTPYLGECSIEVQIFDSSTGQVLAEFTETKIGKKYDAESAKKWVNGYMDSFSTWGYAKASFDQWAALFRLRLDELRGIKAEKAKAGK
jgi:hypothetical protein